MSAFTFDANGQTFVGETFTPDTELPAPAVLVFHDWSGCNDMAKGYAETITELGYVGIAVDVYGGGWVGDSTEEKAGKMMPLVEQRDQLLNITTAALKHAKELAEVDANNVAAIGFCFGGLCALDLARSGAEFKAAISFHGALHASPAVPTAASIKPSVLVLHGDADKMVPFEHVSELREELNKVDVDWQLNIYSGAQHAFMNPDANDPEFGTVYHERVAMQAWDALQLFLWDSFDQPAEHHCDEHCDH